MMSISTRGRYATRIMALLACERDQGRVNKYHIAAAEAISPGYVQQILMVLRTAGLVTSYRGRGGGFSLAKPPQEISVGDILHAVEGDLMPAPCRGSVHCGRAGDCPTRPVWDKATRMLDELFSSTTLADLVKGVPI